MPIKKIISFTVILVSLLTIPFSAKDANAATADFYDTKNSVTYKAAEYRVNPTLYNQLINGLDSRGSDFVYENRSKGFNYQLLLDTIMTKMGTGKDVTTAFGECLVDSTIQVAIPTITPKITISSVSVWNPILSYQTVTVNDSSLVKAAYDGTTVLSFQVKDATHVTVFSDTAPTSLALAGNDGTKIYANGSAPTTDTELTVIGIE